MGTRQTSINLTAKDFFRKFKHTHSPDNYYLALVEFAKFQQERSYSEEDMRKAFSAYSTRAVLLEGYNSFDEFIEQFKKK